MDRLPSWKVRRSSTIILFLLLVSFSFVITPFGAQAPVAAAAEPKGGLYVLDGGPSGAYSTGGTVLVDWRDFEPEEGVYRWELLRNSTGRFLPWLEVFNARLQNRDPQSQPVPGQIIYGAHAGGNKVRLKLRVTEGAVPLWLYGGQDVNGKSPKSYGGICAYETYEEVYARDPKCNSQNDIVIAITYPLYPTKEDNAEPVWWNPIFQEKMKTVLRVIGQFAENDPIYSSTVEFVEPSVGSYGEMILYGKSDTFKTDTNNQRLFRSAGYTNARYSEAVQKVIAGYMEVFPSFPIALSIGNGLYSGPYDDGSGVISVEGDVIPKLEARYGSRLYLKFAGFGGNRADHTFRNYCPNKTRCIYETFGSIPQWTIDGYEFPFFRYQAKCPNNEECTAEDAAAGVERFRKVLNYALQDGAYIVMLWWADYRVVGNPRHETGLNLTDTENSALSNGFLGVLRDIAPQLRTMGAVNPVAAPTYTLTVNKSGGGTGIVSGSGSNCGETCTKAFTAGVAVALTASPDAGSSFFGWSGACSGTGTCSLAMDSNKSVVAQFNSTSNPGGGGTGNQNSGSSDSPGNNQSPSTGNQAGTGADTGNLITGGSGGGAVVDVDGDGKDDVLWFNGEPGPVYAWYFKGDRFATVDVHRDVATPNWKMAGGGNLRGDGSYNIFWQNVATGKVYAWLMNRGAYLGEQYIQTVEDTQWKMVGVGDFDDDGNVDLVWHHQGTGMVYIWFMNGANFLRDQHVATLGDLRWQVVGVGDLNGDGKAEILWQHADGGSVYIWYMDGANLARDQYVRNVEDANWKIIGIGKFSDLKEPNILWRHQGTGEIYIWYLDNGKYVGDAKVLLTPGN